MNIVCFGQQNWDVAWTAKQQLLSRLARRGHRILFVNPIPADAPRTWGGRWRAAWPMRYKTGLEEVEDGVHVFTPTSPEWLPRRLRGYWQRRTIASVAERLGLWAPVVLCCWPAQRWLIDALNPSATVYLAFDDNTSFAGVSPAFAQHQQREELRLLGECDMALAVSPTLVERFGRVHPRSYLQENGVELEDFRSSALEAAEPHPVFARLPRSRYRHRVGFVGQIDDRLDQDLLVKLARERRDTVFVLAGRVPPHADVRRLEAEPNVVLAGFVEYRQLAGIYRELDAGLVPYVSSPLTQACNPLKVYEYLAAGLPVVSTDLAGLNSARGAISVARSHDEFAEALDRALADPGCGAERRYEIARQASWHRRVDDLEARLREARELAQARREAAGVPHPRPDRHGRVAVRLKPRLDGKDHSVWVMHDAYAYAGLSRQQHALYLVARMVGMCCYGVRRVGRLLRGDLGSIRRILVVRNGHLGDTVVFFPTLAALRRRFPTAHIAVAVAPGSGAKHLLAACRDVDEVVEVRFYHTDRLIRLTGVARLVARGFDLVVSGAWYFYLPEAAFSGAPKRLGLYDGHPLQRYADRVMQLDPALHEAENNLRLVELLGGPVPLEQRVPRLALDESAVAEAGRRLRRRLGLEPGEPVVALHPGSKRPSRRWAPERFAELAEALLERHPELRVVFTGAGEEEQVLINGIIGAIDPRVRRRAHSAAEGESLMEVIGLYDTCRLLVCNDTGVMHVARSRGVPLVAVIGPENDRRWGPHPLGPAPAIVVRSQTPGTPHGKWHCPWDLSLLSIQTDRVLSHVETLLAGSAPAQPISVGGGLLYPLHRDVQRVGFAELAEQGIALPSVAVVVPRDPALLGFAGEPVSTERLAAVARQLHRQQYPSLEVVLLTDDADALGRLETAEAKIVAVPPRDPDAAWSAVMAATQAMLLLPSGPEVSHAHAGIGNRVSVYLRGPEVAACDEQSAVKVRHLLGQDLLSGRWLLTRETLETLLMHPVVHPPPPLQPDEEDETDTETPAGDELPQIPSPAAVQTA